MTEIGNTECLVPREKFLRYDMNPPGNLYAMMLDTKHTFDELIERYAPNEEIKHDILKNRFYQNLSSAMAGSHEYLAMEKLYQIYLRGRYDLIVLDTPPTRHALDFLEAPGRVRAFFDRGISQWFLKPYLTMGRIGLQLLNHTASTVFKLIERVTGAEFLRDVSEFVTGLADSFDIFRSRAEEVMHVLRGESTSFLLVTATQRAALEEAAYFYDRLRAAGLPFGGIIVNRVNRNPFSDCGASPFPRTGPVSEGVRASLKDYLSERRSLPPAVAAELVENFCHYQELYERDRATLEEFSKSFPGRIPLRVIPILDEDIFDLDGLAKINAHLFPASAGPA
jgi:anion-transporting  ArsA/GET3 family ATPase